MNLEEYCINNNLIYGVCKADIFNELYTVLQNNPVPFVEMDIEKRINPFLTFPKAKSIIAVGLGYKKVFTGSKDNKKRGRISFNAMGLDYHIKLKTHMEEIMKLLDSESVCFSDTGPLVDREIAKKCGLGFQGKNLSIINHKIGSMFNIGYILTSKEFETYNNIVNDNCGNCNLCISACPTYALSKSGYKYNCCISYLTQTKEEVPEYLSSKMCGYIYGCDICQSVCPYNKEIPCEEINDIDIFYPNLEKILNLSNKEFKILYKQTSAGWRGKKQLQKNAEIALRSGKHGILE